MDFPMFPFHSILVICLLLFSHAGRSQNLVVTVCDSNLHFTDTGKNPEQIRQLLRMNKVSDGDAGETDRPEKYLLRFRNLVNYFDSSYSVNDLINITKENKCPIITSYSFYALLISPSKRPPDSVIAQLLLHLASDTTSCLRYDFGDGSQPVRMFEFLLHLVTMPDNILSLFKITPIPEKLTRIILSARKKYFTGTSGFGGLVSWDNYCKYYLHQ